MCGTDYNLNIPKIGPESAYKLLTEHKSLENIEKNTKYNTDILNYRRGRELFSNDKSQLMCIFHIVKNLISIN